MFILQQNNHVILGPKDWNQRMFQSVVNDELGLDINLPVFTANSPAFILNETTSILPVEFVETPSYNSKIEQLAGPFWDYQVDKAIASYTIVPKNIDAVKNELKGIVANTRYNREVAGIKVTIQGLELNVYTARGERDIYAQALLLNAGGKNWKFGSIWITLSTAELQEIVSAIMTHIQTCFDWESATIANIDSKNALTELNSIVVVDTPTPPQI